MWPFSAREQRPIPDEHLERLEQVPDGFNSDGCSNSPDRWAGWDFRPYCLVHDVDHCSRCQPPDQMDNAARIQSNERLRRGLKAATPWRWRWLANVYYEFVHLFSGVRSWDSCDPDSIDIERQKLLADGKLEPEWMQKGLCRHHMPLPDWMKPKPKKKRAKRSSS